MRILLDECMPARLALHLTGHSVQTVPQAGWAGVKNGRLLELIGESGKFDLFVTMDKNLPRQQQLDSLPFAVVVFRANSSSLENALVLIPEFLRRLEEFAPGNSYLLTQMLDP